MPTNQQRRAAERRRLQAQLEERRAREIARRRFTLITSIIGTIVVVAAIVVIVVVATSGNDDKKKPAAKAPSATPSTSAAASPSASASAAPAPIPTEPCKSAKGASTTFEGISVTGATNLKAAPKFSGKGAADPKALVCQDLVVGKGATAKTTSTATVQYIGLVYKTGKKFQASWDTGKPVAFPLAPGPQGVIPGFSQGIAGAGKVAPMRVGGRRILVMPAVDAYGATPPQGSGIPANATLVFIVDLTKVAAS